MSELFQSRVPFFAAAGAIVPMCCEHVTAIGGRYNFVELLYFTSTMQSFSFTYLSSI